jgi:hemerythrin-like domain-containing protein
MSAQTPIKRSGHIAALSRDHHFTLLFCWKIRNGLKFKVEPGRIKSYVRYFWQHHMQPHFKEEENVLFALVQDTAVQKALNEHAWIAEQVHALNGAADSTEDQFLILADSVDNHVRYEERELYPHLEDVLSGEQLCEVGKQLASHRTTMLQDGFADAFWLKDRSSL